MTLPDETSDRTPGQVETDLAPPPASRLSEPLSSLIGRERELRLVCDLLQRKETRLVTLTGLGGVGKTRLAHAVAATLENEFPNGVAYVPLETVRDPEQSLPVLASAFGISEGARASRYHRMRDQRMLLLLDNFEQILFAGVDLARVLEASPGVRALVTSRVVLRISGERDVPLEPLEVPVWEVQQDIPALRATPSVRLFMERAIAHDPSWSATVHEVPVIAEICRRLDGLLLAIELAAARTAVLPPADLNARLDQLLPLFVGGSRDLPERLQTMRSAIS